MIQSALKVRLKVRVLWHRLIAGKCFVLWHATDGQIVELISAFEIAKERLEHATLSLPLQQAIDIAVEVPIFFDN